MDGGAGKSKNDVIKYPIVIPWIKGYLIAFFFKFIYTPLLTIQLYAI